MWLRVTGVMNKALSDMSDGSFQAAGATLSDSKQLVREKLQVQTAHEIGVVLGKLSNKIPLDDKDIALVQLWIVGDAESYDLAENDLAAWVAEYERLSAVLSDFEKKEDAEQDLFKLGGILEDAVRISYDIANLLEKRDRLQRFKLAVADGLDDQERLLLLEILQRKLQFSGY